MKKAVALSVLLLVLLFGGVAFSQSPDSVQAQLADIKAGINDLKAQNSALTTQVNSLTAQSSSLTTQVTSLTAQVASLAANNKGPRQFCLTKTGFNGSQALTACAAGYHMASLWEIFDTTVLRYNTALGLTKPDSGSGPPVGDQITVGRDALRRNHSVDLT